MSESTNGNGAITGAIISTDPGFRSRLVEVFLPYSGLEFALQVDEPFTAITDQHLQELRDVHSDVVFVDLESDPQVGLKFAQFLMEANLASAVVGAGNTDSPDLLLQAMQAGVLEFLPRSLDSDRIEPLMGRLRKKTGKPAVETSSHHQGSLLSVFSPKGGSGATAFAVNLAVSMHQLSRKRTLIVDLDLELGETALLLGMEPRFSSVDLVRNYHRVDEGLLASYIERDKSGVDLLSAPYQPADFQTVDGDRIGSILRFLKDQYDYVIVDASKSLNPVTLNAFEASDHILLLTTADLQSLRNVTRSLPLLKGLAESRPDDWIQLVVNRFNPSLAITVGEVERTLGMKVSWVLRNDYRSVIDSINEGRPAVLGKKSVYAENVRAVAADITGVGAREKPKPKILGRLLAAARE